MRPPARLPYLVLSIGLAACNGPRGSTDVCSVTLSAGVDSALDVRVGDPGMVAAFRFLVGSEPHRTGGAALPVSVLNESLDSLVGGEAFNALVGVVLDSSMREDRVGRDVRWHAAELLGARAGGARALDRIAGRLGRSVVHASIKNAADSGRRVFLLLSQLSGTAAALSRITHQARLPLAGAVQALCSLRHWTPPAGLSPPSERSLRAISPSIAANLLVALESLSEGWSRHESREFIALWPSGERSELTMLLEYARRVREALP